MKKFYAMLFAALVMALSFSQCSKDKDSDDDDDRKASSSSSSSISESDLTGTWVISEAKYGTYDMSEYLRNETWSFNNGSFRGALYGDDYYNCNYTYKNGKLTISGGDLYEEDDDDYWYEEKFEFSSIKIEGTILTLSGNIIQTEYYEGETYNDRESCYFRLEKQGGNGGNSDVSDILGTWYVDYCAVDGDDYTDSEGYRNKTWTFYNNQSVSGYFGWNFDCNYTYQNGTLTLSGGDFYESEYGYTEEIIMKFTNVQRNGDILTLSGNVTYRIVEDGETDTESSSIYIRLSKNVSYR